MNNNDNSSLQMHSFNKIIAKKCGILSAVIYNHIEFWIQKNEANEKHFYDGKYWTYSTLTGMQKIFDYATVKQIRLAIDKLIKAGLIETGNYNKTPYDRTLWYSIKGKIDLPKKANGNSQKGTPIPDILTDKLKDNILKISNEILSTPENDNSTAQKMERQKMFDLLVNICKIDPNIKRGHLNKTIKILMDSGYTSADLEKFSVWWNKNDWRGVKGQPPTLGQVAEFIFRVKELPADEENEELEAYITPEGERRFRRKVTQ